MKSKNGIIYLGFRASCSYRMTTKITPGGIFYFIRRTVTILKIIVQSVFNSQQLSIDTLLKDTKQYDKAYFSRLSKEIGIVNVESHNTKTVQKILCFPVITTQDMTSNAKDKYSVSKQKQKMPDKQQQKDFTDNGTQTIESDFMTSIPPINEKNKESTMNYTAYSALSVLNANIPPPPPPPPPPFPFPFLPMDTNAHSHDSNNTTQPNITDQNTDQPLLENQHQEKPENIEEEKTAKKEPKSRIADNLDLKSCLSKAMSKKRIFLTTTVK